MPDPLLIDFRCPNDGCGKLLFKVSDIPGTVVEARCPRCREVVTARLEDSEQEAT